MDHDPFCKSYHPDLLPVERCAWCSVIKRVRKDEQQNLDFEYWIGYHNGYEAGYQDCQKQLDGYQQLSKDYD
jgi:hypothetical protein